MPLSIPVTIDYLELWHQALADPKGLVITFEGPRRVFRDRLYRARAAANDPDLKGLSLIMSPMSAQEIIIVHKQIEVPDETPEA